MCAFDDFQEERKEAEAGTKQIHYKAASSDGAVTL